MICQHKRVVRRTRFVRYCLQTHPAHLTTIHYLQLIQLLKTYSLQRGTTDRVRGGGFQEEAGRSGAVPPEESGRCQPHHEPYPVHVLRPARGHHVHHRGAQGVADVHQPALPRRVHHVVDDGRQVVRPHLVHAAQEKSQVRSTVVMCVTTQALMKKIFKKFHLYFNLMYF